MMSEKRQAYLVAYRETHKEQSKAWREAHKEEEKKKAQVRSNGAHRRLSVRRSKWNKKYGLLLSDVIRLLEVQNHVCFGCGEYVDLWTLSIDHIVATTKGGISNITNYQLLCYLCNLAKMDTSMEDFITRCTRVAEFHK